MNGQLLEIHAREVAKMPDEWEVYAWECIGEPVKVVEVKGCFKPPTITRGPRKGQSNWRKRDKTSERIVHITPEEHKAWIGKWVERTGLCVRCVGKGEVLASIGVSGTTYRECPKCSGTGKVQTVAVDQ